MIGKKATVTVLVLAWAAVFAGSFVASSGIEGPRNIDTGFKRLDVLVQYQIVALALAIASAALGFAWRRQAKRILPIGLVPLAATVLLVAGVALAATILGNRPAPQSPGPPPKPTAPAADLPAATQD